MFAGFEWRRCEIPTGPHSGMACCDRHVGDPRAWTWGHYEPGRRDTALVLYVERGGVVKP